MELYEFAANYPELYDMFNEDVRYFVTQNKLNGSFTLEDMDNAIDNMLKNYEQDNYFGYDMDEIPMQQIPYGGYRDMDRMRRRRRRRFRDFNIRDIIRILFLRELFDRNRRY